MQEIKLIILETKGVFYVDKKLLKRVLLRKQLGLLFINPKTAVINRKSLYWLFEIAPKIFI